MRIPKDLVMTHLKRNTLLLSGKDVQQIVSHIGVNVLMDSLIERLDLRIRNFDVAITDIPVRSGFSYDSPKAGLIEWMPLFQTDEQVMIKIVGYHPSNPTESGLPTILSTFSAYDTDTGHLAALMDGVLATALRTGAAAAVATTYMAHPDSKVLGLIGCGVQGVTQLQAILRVLKIDRVLIYDSDPAALYTFEMRCQSFAAETDIRISDIGEIVRESDVISTATSIDIDAGPLFNHIEPKPHLHINAIGSDFPGKIELPLELLKKSVVVPDFREQALIEGECQQIAKEDIGPEISEVVKKSNTFCGLKTQLTVFDSTGWALEDKVVMELFLEHARTLGFGKEVAIESMPEDSKHPFEFLETSGKAHDDEQVAIDVTA